MNTEFEMKVIGSVTHEKGFAVRVDKAYKDGLLGLGEFSHVMILWVFDQVPWDGKTLIIPPPYKKLTHNIGLFATRSPFRPNPIAVSTSRILSVDEEEGIICLDWIDADDKSPVIDIKPYHPSEDLVNDAQMPDWCVHWPQSREESGEFDWESEFTFGF
jgi:tRNA-Thr(GGU) m(6)t(6)A37 methyltransferase TsaA